MTLSKLEPFWYNVAEGILETNYLNLRNHAQGWALESL
jgi:hypothetical protein